MVEKMFAGGAFTVLRFDQKERKMSILQRNFPDLAVAIKYVKKSAAAQNFPTMLPDVCK